MIREIELHNFKCFVDKKIELNEMTVLAGANATGKSSVIQSVLLQEEALNRSRGGQIDKISMMRYPVGNLNSLIAHNRKDLLDGDMRIKISYTDIKTDVIYTSRRGNGIDLATKIISEDYDTRDKVIYLQSERMGARISYPAESDEDFRPDGSNAPFIIFSANNNNRGVHSNLEIAGESVKIEQQFQAWMSAILGQMQVSLNTDVAKASTDIRFKNVIADDWVYPPLTGFGISYVESIIAAGLWCSIENNIILIIENPEAHLHPAAQSMIGKFLFLVAMSGVQLIVETHSEHVIDGIRLQARCMKKTDSINVLFFWTQTGMNETGFDKISVNKNGELDRWPEGFFDQKTKDLRELFAMRGQ